MELPPVPDILIRPMTLADVEQVHAIDVQSFSMPWSERSFRYELTENPASRPWVAELIETLRPNALQPKKLIGIEVLWLILDEAHIGTIAVLPEHRSQGVGRRLLAHSLLAAYNEGASTSFLEVRRNNLPAQALYRKFGYEVAGVRPRYYKDTGEDALLMTLAKIHPAVLKRLVE